MSALNLQGRELCCTVCKSSATPDFSQQTLVHWCFTCWFLSSMLAYGDVHFTALVSRAKFALEFGVSPAPRMGPGDGSAISKSKKSLSLSLSLYALLATVRRPSDVRASHRRRARRLRRNYTTWACGC